VCRGYWRNKIGKPHAVPCKVTGRLWLCAGVPRGTGIVLAPMPKKLLLMAGIDDCYPSARGCTSALGNFAKAAFDTISKTDSYLAPDLWKETVFTKSLSSSYWIQWVRGSCRSRGTREKASHAGLFKSLVTVHLLTFIW
ncbi:hypothetical protein EGK_07815, partial [Macaca mulatta]